MFLAHGCGRFLAPASVRRHSRAPRGNVAADLPERASADAENQKAVGDTGGNRSKGSLLVAADFGMSRDWAARRL